jgi:hypothetical protein
MSEFAEMENKMTDSILSEVKRENSNLSGN